MHGGAWILNENPWSQMILGIGQVWKTALGGLSSPRVSGHPTCPIRLSTPPENSTAEPASAQNWAIFGLRLCLSSLHLPTTG